MPRQATVDRMQALLRRAAAQSRGEARALLIEQALDALTPDEASILATLAAAERGVPTIHIHCLTSTGLRDEPVLTDASLVGRRAEVALPDLTPLYLGRLRDRGLVATGPEDETASDDYQALLADAQVLAALSAVRSAGATPRVLRRTVVLTGLGRDVCAGLRPA